MILTYNFPSMTKDEMVFSAIQTPAQLRDEAIAGGFYNGDTPGAKLFNEWFYRGLDTLPEMKKDIDLEYARKAVVWTRCYMASFWPKHEEKEAVCAYIFSEIFELPINK